MKCVICSARKAEKDPPGGIPFTVEHFLIALLENVGYFGLAVVRAQLCTVHTRRLETVENALIQIRKPASQKNPKTDRSGVH